MPGLIRAAQLSRHYRQGAELVRALNDVSFEIAEGEFVAITGPSGSGKSTLLNLLGCMDRPTSGQLFFKEKLLNDATEQEQVQFRRSEVGFVFQHFGLIPTLTVEENILLPQLFARAKNRGSLVPLLEKMGLQERRLHKPSELSGGEMQRVAIGRALINNPKLLLADEPTGNLDSATGARIFELFRELNRHGLTIVVVTHNDTLAQATSRRIELKDGTIRQSES